LRGPSFPVIAKSESLGRGQPLPILGKGCPRSGIPPFNFEKELKILLKLWKRDFRGDIRFLVIDKIVDDSDLKQQFNL